jgi:hypothetical protein
MIYLYTSSRRFGSTCIYTNKFLQNLFYYKLVQWQCRGFLAESMTSGQWSCLIWAVFSMWLHFYAGNYISCYACFRPSHSGRRLLFRVSPNTRNTRTTVFIRRARHFASEFISSSRTIQFQAAIFILPVTLQTFPSPRKQMYPYSWPLAPSNRNKKF